MLAGDVDDDYDVMRQPFAQGVASTLHTCRHRRTGQEGVVKRYDKQRTSARRLSLVRNEVRIALKLPPHPHVIRTYAAYESASHISLVMEAVQGGSLLDKLRSVVSAASGSGGGGGLPEAQVRSLTCQLLAAVAHLHACGVMHRDIKPENVFFRTSSNNKSSSSSSGSSNGGGGVPCDDLTLGDFGFATDSIPSSEYLGSPQYSAPELALIALRATHSHHAPHSHHAQPLYNEKCDVWSVGVVVYVMLTGTLPFDGATPTEVFEAVLRNALPFDKATASTTVSAAAKSFVRALTETNASKRPTAAQALRHPWLLV